MTRWLTLLWCCTLSCPPLVHAWNIHGHEAIGMTAMSALKGGALSQLKRLMNGKDVVDVSSWAQRVNQKFPATSSLHFFKQPDWQCNQVEWKACTLPGDSPSNHRGTGACLVNAMRSLYGRLANKPELNTMKWPEGVKLSDADALKYLIHLIGDMHQPLHVGFDSNDMGRGLMGSFQGSGERVQPTSLYGYWDDQLIDKIVRERPQSWNSGWTHVQSIPARYDKEKQRFAEKKENVFDDWAAESLKLSCDSVYRHPVSHHRMSKGFKIDNVLESVWFELIRQQLLLAGARVAIVLNDILQSREASKLRVGNSVVEGEDDLIEGGAFPTESPSWLRNLGINLGIVTVVLALFAYISRYYSASSLQHVTRRQGGGGGEMVEKTS
eukprot:GHVS01085525.1.p1 GENE.GHVS01085525.1~~GHVS01085525.1.p1  ORF type:complete len:382 (+),score=73.19 GHVS01085525.1:127-1272(+)